MNFIIEAIKNNVKTPWRLRGKPQNENEFNSMFEVGIGLDEEQNMLYSNNPIDYPISWNQLVIEANRLKLIHDNNEYQRQRIAEYPSIADQLDTLYHGGYDAWKASIDVIKNKYPKPTE